MKSSFLPWLPARLVFCLASTISQHEAMKWNSAGKTIKQPPRDGASCTFSSTHTKISGKQRWLKGEGRITILYVHIESLSCKWHSVFFSLTHRGEVSVCAGMGAPAASWTFYGDMKGSEHRAAGPGTSWHCVWWERWLSSGPAVCLGIWAKKQTPCWSWAKAVKVVWSYTRAESHTFGVKLGLKETFRERHLFHLMVSMYRERGLWSVTVPDITFTKTCFKTEQLILGRLWVFRRETRETHQDLSAPSTVMGKYLLPYQQTTEQLHSSTHHQDSIQQPLFYCVCVCLCVCVCVCTFTKIPAEVQLGIIKWKSNIVQQLRLTWSKWIKTFFLIQLHLEKSWKKPPVVKTNKPKKTCAFSDRALKQSVSGLPTSPPIQGKNDCLQSRMITLLIANKSSQEHSSKDTSNYRLAFQAGGACYVPELVRMWKRVRKHDDTTPERKYVSCVFVWWISNFTSSQDNIHSLDYFDEKAFFDSFDRWTLTD